MTFPGINVDKNACTFCGKISKQPNLCLGRPAPRASCLALRWERGNDGSVDTDLEPAGLTGGSVVVIVSQFLFYVMILSTLS